MAIVVEVFVALAIAIGLWTRPLALLLALYTLGTALIGHHFWTLADATRNANAINFYKNIAIIGGFLLLYVTGAGKYSVDARLGQAEPSPRYSAGAGGSPRSHATWPWGVGYPIMRMVVLTTLVIAGCSRADPGISREKARPH